MAKMEQTDATWGAVFDRKNKEKVERSIIDVLKGVPIFEELSRREIQNIARIAYQRHYNAGEVIIHEGQNAAGMYVMVDGQAEVTKALEDGTILHLTTLENSGLFGDVGLLDSSPRTATVKATRDSSVIGFFRPELLELMNSNPRLASKVIFKLGQILTARFRFVHDEFEKAQAEIGRLKAQLTTTSSTSGEDGNAISNETAISGSGLEIEAPNSINSDASKEEENQ
ncbi:cyclic nucleotide-binding domain-containing protein [Candidatus Poribacteria bacterium]|nr:cyclic nucleotide-binding domain-containing protein [Candidatus Poribacteria bacterium]